MIFCCSINTFKDKQAVYYVFIYFERLYQKQVLGKFSFMFLTLCLEESNMKLWWWTSDLFIFILLSKCKVFPLTQQFCFVSASYFMKGRPLAQIKMHLKDLAWLCTVKNADNSYQKYYIDLTLIWNSAVTCWTLLTWEIPLNCPVL